MAICIGYVRSRVSTSVWKPCARAAAARGRLCAVHRDGLDGALLGMLEFEEIRQSDQAQLALKASKKQRKRSSPMRGTRNAAAANTMPERLEPDPARACPAPTRKSDKAVKSAEVQI